MTDGTDVFDIIHTTRSMRRLKPDPVPDALIRRILEAGQCAPSGGNAQRWRFLVIKDPAIKKAVQVWYQRAFDEVIGPRYRTSAPPPGVHSYAILPIGYPMGKFGPLGRGPLAEIVYGDHWGEPWSGAA
jgi:nitroreductase